MSTFKGPEGQEDMPYLLTPGPVTTSRGVKFAMLADYGAHDREVARHLRGVQQHVLKLAHAGESHDCVCVGGAPERAIDSLFASLLPSRRKKTLVIVNGADSAAAASAIERTGHSVVRLSYRETSMPKAADVAKELEADRSIAQVFVTHCETSSGMLLPLQEIAAVVKAAQRRLVVDASCTFGGIDIDVGALGIDALVASASASLASVPGLSVMIIRNELLASQAEQPCAVTLDVRHMHKTQTTDGSIGSLPAHAIVALREALREFDQEGGIMGRSQRYKRNANTLRERLKALGLQLFLPDDEASPIVQTVLAPKSATFDHQRFAEQLRHRGFAVAPGTLAQRASFRVGNIGQVTEDVILHFIEAIEDVLNHMEVRVLAPAES